MSQCCFCREYRTIPRRVSCYLGELNQQRSRDSRDVASGELRDYAIDQLGGAASVAVVGHTHDAPLYAVAKQGSSRSIEYVVFSGREKLRRGKTLSDALKVFNRHLRVVS